MDRRDSLKTIAIGSLSVTAFLSACNDKNLKAGDEVGNETIYGRTPEEAERDTKLNAEKYFTPSEILTITILSDIIIPADKNSGSASQAGVPSFIEFTVKDQPSYQVPMRGGLRWLDMQSLKRYNKVFAEISKVQQIEMVDLIAYPEQATPDMGPGVAFFNRMRNLTATGFFTSKIGIKDLGYVGNQANAWDGVPADVLQQYGVTYDEKTVKECLKMEDRGKLMNWDEVV